MPRTIDYFFATVSPWSYLGHDRLVALAREHGAQVAVKPMNLMEVFPVSGGLPLPKRAPQRQAYRLVELARWAEFLGKPMRIQPAHFPTNGTPAATWILAAAEGSADAALALTGALHQALWEEDRDIADPATLAACARACGLDPAALGARAPALAARYAQITQEAIDRGVFGAPTYVLDGEMFWGQDRLDFLARKLAK
ncbi:MAG: 2-hydroxychromene-2-carboxylate isomerase [Burkholderiales bacterium]